MSEFEENQQNNAGQQPANAARPSYTPTGYRMVNPQNNAAPAYNTSYQQPSSQNNKNGGMGRIIAGACIGAAATAVLFFAALGVKSLFNGAKGNSSVSGSDVSINMVETQQTDTTIKKEGELLTPAQVAAKVRPSIVSVITTDNLTYNSANSGEGSGIILSSDGYIVTNSHVIGDSKQYSVSVITDDGTTFDAVVKGYDTRSDLAVLKINGKNLPACELGDSSKLVLGDSVIAIGNPGGHQFAGSITSGLISGIDRIIDSSDMDSTSAMRYLQTDAAINPGNSGGALVNMYGQVIGVNTSKISATGYEGMGFAIPSVIVKQVTEDLINYGYVQGRVKLGITCTQISSAYESQGIPAGLQIYSIAADSDLNGKAQVYDIITECDGKRITSLSQLQDVIFGKKPGDSIELKLYHPASKNMVSNEYTIKVKLLEDTGSVEEENQITQQPNNNGGYNNYNDFWNDFFGNGFGY